MLTNRLLENETNEVNISTATLNPLSLNASYLHISKASDQLIH
jgi:hypothetical protein